MTAWRKSSFSMGTGNCVRADPPGNAIDAAAAALASAFALTSQGYPRRMAEVALTAAAPVIAAQAARDERQRIIDLAEQVDAHYPADIGGYPDFKSFADLLRGAETAQDAT